MTRPPWMARTMTLTLATLLGASPAGALAQDATSSPSPSAAPLAAKPAWPTGDQLRRELQEIGFAFRVDRKSGDWLGWAPRAAADESPALTLLGAGSSEASASFQLDLLQTEQLGNDVDATLTAIMEVAARVPLRPADVDRTRRFVIGELLIEPPETLEPCYASVHPEGAILISTDAGTGLAEITLGPADAIRALGSGSEVGPGADDRPDLDSCPPIAPAVDGVRLGDPTSERITISMLPGDPPTFDPAEVTLEGSLVTLVLTFENGAASEQTLTFDEPLTATTGPVEPGGVKLIVVRQLTPGEYPFHVAVQSDGGGGAPASPATGLISIVEPTID